MTQISRFFLNPFRLVGLIIMGGLVAVGWINVAIVNQGLTVRYLEQAGVPMRYMVRNGAEGVEGVLLAHGFGGSQQLMLGYGYTLAHAGYGVLLWDFNGHAANRGRFDPDSDILQMNIETAYTTLVAQPEVNGAKVAIVGHSMGSGAAMRAGIDHPEHYQAVVAISPIWAEVSSTTPTNLLLQAGEWEPDFVQNAQRLLQQAGGENRDLAHGLGRRLAIIPHAEHILILFQPDSHQETLQWLNAVFERPSGPLFYHDNRLLFYLLHLAGVLGLAVLLVPLIRPTTGFATVSVRPLFLVLAPLMATVALFLLNQVWQVAEIGGVLVGGGGGIWFGVLGGVGLWAVGVPARPRWGDVGRGILLFALLWLAFGLLAQFSWLPWFLTGQRLQVWLPLAAFCLPAFLVWGQTQQGQSYSKQLLWWLGHTLLIVSGLVGLIYAIPTMGVLFLVLPLLPIVFGVMGSAGIIAPHSWSFALGNALFFSWLLLSYFPLAS